MAGWCKHALVLDTARAQADEIIRDWRHGVHAETCS
jgi:hypothetical protein